jgi:hypothetical protein
MIAICRKCKYGHITLSEAQCWHPSRSEINPITGGRNGDYAIKYNTNGECKLFKYAHWYERLLD